MKREIAFIRVDPIRQAVAKLKLPARKDLTRDIQRVCRAKNIGFRELQNIDGTTLVVAASTDTAETVPGWRMLGGEDTAGISILYGALANASHMVDVPVDVAWLLKRISWTAGEDVKQREERAAEIMGIMPPELLDVVRTAVPAPDGDLWLPVSHAQHFAALVNLGVSTPLSKGQRLSPVGVTILDRLEQEAR